MIGDMNSGFAFDWNFEWLDVADVDSVTNVVL
jgi:hypothetical protein